MKALTIPLLVLLSTIGASAQLINITINDKITEPVNSTGLATDGSVYSGSPITANVAWSQDELQLAESGFNGANSTAYSRYDGAKLSLATGNYGHSTVDASLGLFISPTGSAVSFLTFSGIDANQLKQSDLSGSLFDNPSEIPLTADPLFLGADSYIRLESSAFAGEFGKLSVFETLLFNDPHFLETFSRGSVALQYRRTDGNQESHLGLGSPPLGNDSPSFVLTGTAVPEPSTYGLFGALGLVCLIGHRRFRQIETAV